MKSFLLRLFVFLLPVPFIYWQYQVYEFTELGELNKAMDQKVEIILFGSSVNKHLDPEDTDRRSISEMLHDISDQSAFGISHSAYHADIYLEFCRYISELDQTPKVVVLPVNMRTFSPEWDLRPEYQFVKEKRLLYGFPFYNPAFTDIDSNDFKATPVYRFGKEVGSVDDFTILHRDSTIPFDQSMEMGFTFHYLYNLEKEHRKIQSLKKCAEVLAAGGVQTIYYLTPIDYQRGERYFGKAFTTHLNQNIETVTSMLEANGVPIIDLSQAVDSTYFDYQKIPNEHVDEVGRMFIADEIRKQVESLNSNR